MELTPPISGFEKKEIYGVPQDAGEDDGWQTIAHNDDDPSSLVLKTASASSLSMHEKLSTCNPSQMSGNFELMESDLLKPMLPEALHSVTVRSKTSSSYKARKARTKLRMYNPFAIGVNLTESSMRALNPSVSKDVDDNYPVETKDSLPLKERKKLEREVEGVTGLHVKGKPLQFTEKINIESDYLRMQKICHDVDLDDKKSSDLLNSDVFEDNKLYGDERDLCMHSNSDASKGGVVKQNGYIKAEEKEVMLCDQQTHFLAWFAGLTIRSIRLQFRFIFHLFVTLLLACYHSFLFTLNPMSYMLKAKVRTIEAHRKGNDGMVTLGPNIKERVCSVQPTIFKGARRLVFGCSAAVYTVMMLTLLFITSLVLSYWAVKEFVYEPVQLYEDLYFDYTKPLPVASADFAFSRVYPDTGSIMRRIARPTRKFHTTVFFTMPESDFNKELGIFQVTTELLSETGQVLISRTQPCMLRFQSTTLQRAKSLLMAIPLLTGFYSETQMLAVNMLWQEHRVLSFAAVRVMLAPRAGRPLAMGLPELYKAKLRVNSELPWWVSMIGRWRWTISVWMGMSLFTGVLVLLLCVCKQILIPDLGLILSYGVGEFHMGIVENLKHKKPVSDMVLEDTKLCNKKL